MEGFSMGSSFSRDFPELLKIDSPKSIKDVRGGLERFIQTEQALETAINLAHERCELSKIKGDEAKKYDDAWYKIGATKKKVKMLAESQSSMQEAMESLQYGQSLTFQFQQDLASFCTVCLSIAKGHESQLNDLADIIFTIHERSKNEPIPNVVLMELDKLRLEVENEKNIIKSRKEAERNKSLLKKEYISSYLLYGLMVVLFAIIIALHIIFK